MFVLNNNAIIHIFLHYLIYESKYIFYSKSTLKMIYYEQATSAMSIYYISLFARSGLSKAGILPRHFL